MNPQLKRTNYADFFSSTQLPVLEEIFEGSVKQHPSLREMIFKVESTDRDIWQYTEVHDMPLFSSVNEGADYTFSTTKQGSDKTVSIVKYALGFSISEESIEDGKFNFMADATRKLARSARESQEQAAMDIFNNGFTTVTTADGVSLFNTAHTTPSGTYTIANKPSTDADLSFSSLSNAITSFDKAFRGDSGIYMFMRPQTLLVPSELKLLAQQLVKSTQEPQSQQNQINPFYNELQVVSSPHLSDTDAWFLVSNKEDHGLRIVQRKPLELVMAAANSVGFLNDTVSVKARYREIITAVKPHGVYGTTGAA